MCEPQEVQQGQVQGAEDGLGQSQAQTGRKWIESSPGEELGVLVDERLDIIQQRALAAKKFSHFLGCFQSSVASTAREEIVSLALFS